MFDAALAVARTQVRDPFRLGLRLHGQRIDPVPLPDPAQKTILVAELQRIKLPGPDKIEPWTARANQFPLRRLRQNHHLFLTVTEVRLDAVDRHRGDPAADAGEFDEGHPILFDPAQPPLRIFEAERPSARRRNRTQFPLPVDELPPPVLPLPGEGPVAGTGKLLRRSAGVRLPVGVRREEAAALFRLFVEFQTDRVLRFLGVLREELDLLPPRSRPQDAVPVVVRRALQLRGTPAETEQTRLLARRTVDQLNRKTQFRREVRRPQQMRNQKPVLRQHRLPRAQRLRQELDVLRRDCRATQNRPQQNRNNSFHLFPFVS